MATLLLEPEFFLDFDGTINTDPILLENGRIKSFGWPLNEPDQVVKLKDQLILPGFVNAHSHCFQRGLRGLVEKASGVKDNFWTWREKMYALANTLCPDDLSLIAELTFLEMLESGFTHVGEFHYLHHGVGKKPLGDPLEMSKAVVKAALNAGINLCLLETAYNRYGFNQPLKIHQNRFAHNDVGSFLEFTKEALALKNPNVSIGTAIHSVRAVPEQWFSAINDFALAHNMPVHIHVSEQLQEVADCLKTHGCSPIKLLAKNHLLAPHTTLVHATHLIDDDVELIDRLKPNLCICPSTEKNLGDGMIEFKRLRGVSACIGTDQHVRLDPWDEVRSLEEQERLRLKYRGVLPAPGNYLYQALYPYLTLGGLKSLYPFRNSASLLGQPANLISFELPPEYYWHGPNEALDAMMLSYNPSKLVNVITNGHFILQDKMLLNQEKPYLIKILKRIFQNQ